MSYKKVELNHLQHLASVADQQSRTVSDFLATLDNMDTVPTVTDALSIQDLVYSTVGLLSVVNNVIMQELSNVYDRELIQNNFFAQNFMNMPDTIAHTLNIQELDNSFETNFVDEEEDDDDEDRPPATQ